MEEHIEQATAAPGEERLLPTGSICGPQCDARSFWGGARCVLAPGHLGSHIANVIWDDEK